MERGRYQRGSGCNPQNQTVHHGWLSNQYSNMAGLLKYTKQELYTLRESVYQSHALRILDPSTCARVREYRLNKTRKRGQRGGRQVRLRHRRPTGIKSDNNTRSDTNVTGFSVQCVLVNIQSIKNKEYLLRDELDSINAEFSAITETWLDEHDSAWVDCCQLNRDGYKILTSNHQTRRGGGLALVYKDSNTANVQSAGVKNSFEYMICTMTLKGFILTVILIYHPPYSKRNPITNSTFIDEFSQFLSETLPSHRNAIILGDYNLHLDSEYADAAVFADIMDAMGMVPNVRFSTHKAGHTLDQIYTTLGSDFEVATCHQGLLLSDHHAIHCHIYIPRSEPTQRTVRSRSYRDLDCQTLAGDFNASAIELSNIERAVQSFNEESVRLLDKYAPLKDREVTERKKQVEPWYVDYIKQQKKIVRNRERIWRRYRQSHQWTAYIAERNRLNRMLAGNKILTVSEKVQECIL